ncbi:hypothetical protein V6N11_055597 [Hibiscus sabdariffa]|uniref:Uncharacterized protein n=1 Tax=Hibiscus sabdariffa TaxID=183260 RepID=A0ABR2NR14_9ROSI
MVLTLGNSSEARDIAGVETEIRGAFSIVAALLKKKDCLAMLVGAIEEVSTQWRQCMTDSFKRQRFGRQPWIGRGCSLL